MLNKYFASHHMPLLGAFIASLAAITSITSISASVPSIAGVFSVFEQDVSAVTSYYLVTTIITLPLTGVMVKHWGLLPVTRWAVIGLSLIHI